MGKWWHQIFQPLQECFDYFRNLESRVISRSRSDSGLEIATLVMLCSFLERLVAPLFKQMFNSDELCSITVDWISVQRKRHWNHSLKQRKWHSSCQWGKCLSISIVKNPCHLLITAAQYFSLTILHDIYFLKPEAHARYVLGDLHNPPSKI